MYRNDYEAALARISSLEQELNHTKQELRRLKSQSLLLRLPFNLGFLTSILTPLKNAFSLDKLQTIGCLMIIIIMSVIFGVGFVWGFNYLLDHPILIFRLYP